MSGFPRTLWRDHADSGEALGGPTPGTEAAEGRGGLGWESHCPKPGTMLNEFLVGSVHPRPLEGRARGRRWDASAINTFWTLGALG